MRSHPHLAGDTRISVLLPAFKIFARIRHKSLAITRILFDGNKIAQANISAEREEEYWS